MSLQMEPSCEHDADLLSLARFLIPDFSFIYEREVPMIFSPTSPSLILSLLVV